MKMKTEKQLNLDKLKGLIDCTSKDESRAFLMCVKVDVEKEEFIACDGYRMVKVPFDNEDRETFTHSILLHKDFLKGVIKGRKNIYFATQDESDFTVNVNGVSHTVSTIDYPTVSDYPAFDMIAPKTSDKDFTVTFNYEYLIQLGKAISDSRTKKVSMTFHNDVNGNLDAKGIISVSGDNGSGFLMPMRGD